MGRFLYSLTCIQLYHEEGAYLVLLRFSCCGSGFIISNLLIGRETLTMTRRGLDSVIGQQNYCKSISSNYLVLLRDLAFQKQNLYFWHFCFEPRLNTCLNFILSFASVFMKPFLQDII